MGAGVACGADAGSHQASQGCARTSAKERLIAWSGLLQHGRRCVEALQPRTARVVVVAVTQVSLDASPDLVLGRMGARVMLLFNPVSDLSTGQEAQSSARQPQPTISRRAQSTWCVQRKPIETFGTMAMISPSRLLTNCSSRFRRRSS